MENPQRSLLLLRTTKQKERPLSNSPEAAFFFVQILEDQVGNFQSLLSHRLFQTADMQFQLASV